MKHQPAARHSALYWREGYQQQIDWTNGKRAALSRIKTAKELVAGQAHEMTDTPRAGTMRDASAVLRRRGDAGRRKMKAGAA